MKGGSLLAGLAAFVGLVLGSAVTVWVVLLVSLRSSSVTVPAVVGQPPEVAARQLQAAGLVPRLQPPVPDATQPAGLVAKQRPVAGFQLKRGSAVFLYPSLGKGGTPVPDVRRLPPAMAVAQLEIAGLVEGSRAEVWGEADAVQVVAQSPPPGSLAAPGSATTLLINRGREDIHVVMPDLVGQSLELAKSLLAGWGFRLYRVEEVTYAGLPPHTVVRQSPEAGGPAALGGGVVLWISR